MIIIFLLKHLKGVFFFSFYNLNILGSWAILPSWGPHKWKFNWFWNNTVGGKAWYAH